MQKIATKTRANTVLALAFAGLLFAGSAFADKPAWAGGDKGERGEEHGEEHGKDKHDKKDKQEKKEKHGKKDKRGEYANDERSLARINGYFAEPQRVVVREYYVDQYRGGRCPPGLLKKRNGCLPPGQAKKWVVGRPLPREVVYYAVPEPLVVQIGLPPPGYRYVRVASDILLLAVGTGMVIDAIQGLSGN